jgi:multidrug efflux pump subunit AcrA (membrane-fusion protein)
MFPKLHRLLVILIVGGFLITACSGGKATSTPITGKETASPRKTSGSTVTANGRVVPSKSVVLSFAVNGQVAEVVVEVGAQVKKGDVLARLGSSEQLNADLADAEYELVLAQQELDALNDNLSIAQTDAQQKLADANQTEYDASREQSYQSDKSTLFQKSQADLKLKIGQARVIQAQAEVDKLAAGPDSKKLEAAQARLKAAQAKLASAKAAANPDLTAPFDGTIVDINVVAGQEVTAGQPVIKLADLSTLYIETVDLTEIDSVKVAIGQLTSIIPDALPEVKIPGTVVSIGGIPVEKSGDITYIARISITEPDPRLRWGMTVAVTFEK